ncbi:MAG: CARDB domain-containing protein [Rhodothermales bacterium]
MLWCAVGAGVETVWAQTDETPPALVGTPSVTPSQIDLSGGNVEVTISFQATDAGAGVQLANGYFVSPDGETFIASFQAANTAGTPLDGTWTATTVVLANSPAGTYALHIEMLDFGFNLASVDTDVTLTVTGGDPEPPVVQGIPTLSPQTLDLEAGDQTVSVVASLADNLSGLNSVTFTLATSEGIGVSAVNAALAAGTTLDGTWQGDIPVSAALVALFAPEGNLYLQITVTDVAGNYAQIDTGVELEILRSRAPITFQLDTARLEAVGLFTPFELFEASAGMRLFVDLLSGPDAGVHELSLFPDGYWKTTVPVNQNQELTYVFAIDPDADGANTGDWVYELDGPDGGRSLTVTTEAMTLPPATFDDTGNDPIDASFQASVTRAFTREDLSPVAFDEPDAVTLMQLQFGTLDRPVLVAMRRYAADAGGAPPSGIVVRSESQYWTIDLVPATAAFSANLTLDPAPLSGISDAGALRLLRRSGQQAPWTVAGQGLDADGLVAAGNLSSFGAFTLGSTTAGNTFQPRRPDAPSNPSPSDGDVRVAVDAELTWAEAAFADVYDLYLWPAAEPEPAQPAIAGLETPRAPTQALLLQRNTPYAWRIVARNLDGETPGPVWTFTTQTLPDLQVQDIQAPDGGFSGQPLDISWVVVNASDVPTEEPVWFDEIAISSDAFFLADVEVLAQAVNGSALSGGERYAASSTIRLPEDAVGTYYLRITANAENLQGESNLDNNAAQVPIEIALTPPPDLQVEALTAPLNAFSEHIVNIGWSITNAGTGTATVAGGWTDALYLSPLAFFNREEAVLLTTHSVTGDLAPGQVYTDTASVALPAGISGTYYLYLAADDADDLFEHNGEDNNVFQSDPITVTLSPPPDMVVVRVSVPETVEAGSTIQVIWDVENQGPGAASEKSWQDNLYLSPAAEWDARTAIALTRVGRFGTIAPDSLYRAEAAVSIPDGLEGLYYLVVETDGGRSIFEHTFETNNRGSAPFQITRPPYPDLAIRQFTAPTSAEAGATIDVRWAVANEGDTGAAPAWNDRLYLSKRALWDSTATPLMSIPAADALDVDGSYTRAYTVQLKTIDAGLHYLHLRTDDAGSLFEFPDDAVNNVRSVPIEIAPYPPVDLAVTSFTAPATGSTGQPIDIRWTIENLGEGAPRHARWDDVLYLSADQRLDPDADLEIARTPRSEGLAPGSSYTRSAAVTLPDGVDGTFYLFVQTDDAGQIADAVPSNNSAVSAAPLTIALSPNADLVPTAIDGPASGISGQPVTISWTVENRGEAAAAGLWSDAVFLSTDKTINAQDVRLGTAASTPPLAAGATYETSLDVTLPIYYSGVNYILVAIDQDDDVFEGLGETNNRAVFELSIDTPPPGDLVVTDIVVPETGTPGEPVTIAWTVQNQGENAVRGQLSDAVYLSTDDTWQLEDPLLGATLRFVDLAPGATLSVRKTVDLSRLYRSDAEGNITGELPGLAPGTYRAIVRVDIRNNIRETDEANNATSSSDRIATDLPVLDLGGSITVSLTTGASRYVRVNVPEDVTTFKVTATSDAANASNEVFVRGGAVPTRTEFDVSTRDPFAGDQDVLVPAGEPGSYFVLLFARQGPEAAQLVTLAAEPVSFELAGIDIPRGGTGGAVTVKMTGAAFGRRLRAALEKDGARYPTFDILRTSAVEAYATFDLSDVPTGRYDVVLEQNASYLTETPGAGEPYEPDDIVLRSVLADAFEVVDAPRVEPEISATAPTILRVGQLFTTDIVVANRGDNDMVSPLLLVGTSPATYTTLHPDETVTGGLKRVLALGEGPFAGILRPGEEHRVSFLAQAPDSSALLELYVVHATPNGMPFDFDRELRAASLDTEAFGLEEATDAMRRELAGSGWSGYERLLTKTASRLAKSGIQETDGSRLLMHAVQSALQSLQTPPFFTQTGSVLSLAPNLPINDLPPFNVMKLGASADCSATRLAQDFATLAGAAAGMASPICEGPTGASHLLSFITGGVEGGKIVYGNDSEVANKVRHHDDAVRSFDEVSTDAILAADHSLTSKIKAEGCEGPILSMLPDEDLDHLGVMVNKPSMYIDDGQVGIPYNDPFNDEEEELGLGKHVPGCDLVTGFGGFQSADGRATNITVRRIPTPAEPGCKPGCTVIYRATIEFEFGDRYDFNENDRGEYDLIARNLQDCGVAKGFDTQVNLEQSFISSFEIPSNPKKCKRPPPPDFDIPFGPPITQILVVVSIDPNDMIGPAGYGDEQWVSVSARLPYTIRFENDPVKATAPAQVVTIEQQLDATLDARSFRLGPFGFGDFTFEPPPNVSAYTDRLDVRDALGVFVDVNAGIDIEQNRAFWVIRSIDPATGGAPSNPLAGFLPVNDSLGAGEGFVSYSVRPDREAVTGDRIDALAQIVFDANAPIETPPIFNTVDAGLPTSAVSGLPFKQDTTAFTVSWTARDDPDASGLRSYALYVSRDGDPFEVYQKDLETTQVIFNADRDHRYRFFTIASDQAGNTEPLKTEADAVVQVNTESVREIPSAFALGQNYPNPFNPSTTIPYALPESGDVELIVYNVLGQRVQRYRMGTQPAGNYTHRVDLSALASGVYFYELRVGDAKDFAFRAVRKLVLVK